jgi:DivIVA domain-containing protein
MPLTPQNVRDKVFTATRFRAGYSEQEVDDFLEEVEKELGRLMAENTDLRRQLENRGETPVVHGAQKSEPVEAETTKPGDADHPAVQPAAAAGPAAAPVSESDLPPDTEAEQLLRRTLVLAQRTAEEAIREARQDAEKLRAEAQTQFEQQIGKVEEDRRALEGQVEQLRSFEREYRTRLRAYLELQLRELDAPGSTQGQVEGGMSRPPIGPGGAPAGNAPGGPAGTSPGGPGRPEGESPFNAGPGSEDGHEQQEGGDQQESGSPDA